MAQRPPPTPMLQAFVCAGLTGSFARAATELNLTASAISHQIGGLEAWWGVTLFERHSRGVKLTAAGQVLLPIAQTFFSDLDFALYTLRPGKAAPLELYCTSSLCAAWLIARLHEHGGEPQLVLSACEVNRENLNQHPFDVAIVMGYGDYPGHYVEWLMRDEVFPVCSPGFLQAHGPIGLADIGQHPLIYRIDDPLCPGWEDWFAHYQLTPPLQRQGTRFPDSNLAISLAVKGRGIALGRTSLVSEQLADGSLVMLGEARMLSPSAYYLICRSGRETEPGVAAMLAWLRQQAEEFAPAYGPAGPAAGDTA